ncbi:MAG: hypothetical protein D6688_06760 [Alphaproteobacteria bacterium]|nr:MAG: hypothetical protein D6688_06760 [Alphaproteobacteria bacterium]
MIDLPQKPRRATLRKFSVAARWVPARRTSPFGRLNAARQPAHDPGDGRFRLQRRSGASACSPGFGCRCEEGPQ